MDLTPEALALAARLDEKLRARGKYHVFQPGEMLWCPEHKHFGFNLSDEPCDGDVWMPRLDQLMEMASSDVFNVLAFSLAWTGTTWVATTALKITDAGYHGMGSTAERAIMEMLLATP